MKTLTDLKDCIGSKLMAFDYKETEDQIALIFENDVYACIGSFDNSEIGEQYLDITTFGDTILLGLKIVDLEEIETCKKEKEMNAHKQTLIQQRAQYEKLKKIFETNDLL